MPQRVRVVFRKRGVLQWVSHLDTMRAWERTLRRAGLPLAYTQGFSPHPRIALAAPLPVGFEGERELMDVWLDPALDPALVHGRLEPKLPSGLEIVAVEEVAERLPSLQSLLRTACYRVSYDRAAVDPAALEARLPTSWRSRASRGRSAAARRRAPSTSGRACSRRRSRPSRPWPGVPARRGPWC